MCTCPTKLTLNPYTGCDHGCLYCYASSYVQNFADCRPKKDLLARLKKEAAKLQGEIVSISNSSEPYPCVENDERWMRKSLEILVANKCRIQIITKSDIVTRDHDLLAKVPSAVALTITTNDDHLASILEPHAPSTERRLRAAQNLTDRGIPVSVRVDPIIPFINEDSANLVATLAGIGIKHITSSTYKVKPDNWRRLSEALPKFAEKLGPLYFRMGERVGSNTLLPKELRFKLMKNIRDLATANGMKFGVCREGLPQLNTAPCDGSWLISTRLR